MSRHDLLPVLFLLIIGILVRIAYTQISPTPHIFPDTFGYVRVGQEILTNPSVSTIINPSRPALYPLFLSSILRAYGIRDTSLWAMTGTPAQTTVLFVQTLLSLCAIIPLYLLVRRLVNHPAVAWIVGLIQVTAINLITWERSLLSESFAIPLTMAISILGVLTPSSPSWGRLLSLLALSIIGILLRPSFIIFPLLIFPFIAIYHKRAAVTLRVIVIMSLTLLLTITYAKLNEANHGYYGIQSGSDINVMGRILQFRLPLHPASTIHPIYENVLEYQKGTEARDAWGFINEHGIDVYTAEGLAQVRAFNRAILSHYPLQYVSSALSEIPMSIIAIHPLYTVPLETRPSILWQLLWWVFLGTQYLLLLTLPLIVVAWIRLSRRISITEAQATMMGTIAYGHILLTVVAGEAPDYARFNGFIQPLLSVFLAYWLTRGYQFITRRRKSRPSHPSTAS
jgi:hypothetical protein